MKCVLIIDDNPDIGHALEVLLDLNGLCAARALTPAEGSVNSNRICR
jgi:hypothetical protein